MAYSRWVRTSVIGGGRLSTVKVQWGVTNYYPEVLFQSVIIDDFIVAEHPFSFKNSSRAYLICVVEALLRCGVQPANLYKYLYGWEKQMIKCVYGGRA